MEDISTEVPSWQVHCSQVWFEGLRTLGGRWNGFVQPGKSSYDACASLVSLIHSGSRHHHPLPLNHSFAVDKRIHIRANGGTRASYIHHLYVAAIRHTTVGITPEQNCPERAHTPTRFPAIFCSGLSYPSSPTRHMSLQNRPGGPPTIEKCASTCSH
jgi:hypothetical protein